MTAALDHIEEPVCWLVPATKRPPYLLADAWRDYLWNHCRRKQQDYRRVAYVAKHWLRIMGPDSEVALWKRKDIQLYDDTRKAAGAAGSTIRREMSLQQAALNVARKWEIIDRVVHFEKPAGTLSAKRDRRALTEEEFARLMKSPLPRRIRLFYLIAYWTGHRSRAIETLTWDRVNLEQRTIEFNDPALLQTNKRRVSGYPIPDELLVGLVAAKEYADKFRPADPYVIGLGNRGKCSTTYHDCKQALRAIGISEWGVCRHTVRKTFVTERLKRGIPSALVASLIADLPNTMERFYFIPKSEDMREAANMRTDVQ